VRQGFLELARREPERIVVLDARLDPAQLEARTWEALEQLLQRARG